LGNRRRLSLERHDADDAGALQDRQRVFDVEAREAVAGEERPVDLLLAIFPAAPAGDGGEECVDALSLQLIADHLLVARSRPHRKPLGFRVQGSGSRVLVLVHWDWRPCCFRPSSNALFTSGFFHSMIACERSLARYFWNSTLRLSVNTRSLICSRAFSSVSVLVWVIVSSLKIW